jgi:hypothetical protein
LTEFEKGVRWALENVEAYSVGKADIPELQFGDYMFYLYEKDNLQRGSKEYLEKRIQAYLILAKREFND